MLRIRHLLAALLLAASPAPAQVPGLSDIIEVRLLEGWRMEDGSHMAGLSIELAPGWKTYWRAPGEGGIPPELHLDASTNLAGHAIRWPAPEVFWSNGLRSVGYVGDVLLPLHLEPEGAGPIQLRGEIDLGVCQDICIPVRLTLEGVLDDDGEADRRILAALALQPLTAEEAGAGGIRCVVEPISDGLRLTASIPLPSQGETEHVVVELPETGIWIDAPQVARDGGVLMAMTDLVPPVAAPFALDRSALVFTVIGNSGAVELVGCTG